MNIYCQILISTFTIYIFLLIHVLRYGFKQRLNRLFLSATLFLSIWTMGNVLIFCSATSEYCHFWYKVGSVGHCYYSVCILHFYIVFTGKGDFFRKKWRYILLYFPPTVLLYGFLTGNVIIKDFIVAGQGIIYTTVVYSFWFYYYSFIHLSYLSIGFVIVIVWRVKLKYAFEIQQSPAIISPFFVSMVFGIFFGFYSVNTSTTYLYIMLPAVSIFGTMGTWFATVKYKLTILTPSLAAENILSTMVDSVVLVDYDLKILTVNQETCRMLKYEESELKGKELGMLFNEKDSFHKYDFTKMLKSGQIRNYEAKFKAKDGTNIPIAFSASEYRDKHEKFIGAIVISRDITEQKKAEKSLKHLANHDFLTGLPNRLLFNERLRHARAIADKCGTMIAVMLIDIDRFKEVNDVLGHDIGDRLLVKISERLRTSVRHMDTIARLGGDEFICIISNIKCESDINRVADKIQQAFVPKFDIEGNELKVSVSIGISLYPQDGENADVLVKNADIAMYYVKNQGKNNFKKYTKNLGVECSERLLFESKLRKAVEQNEFVVYYQPIVDVNIGKLISIEALVRWQHPVDGLIPPMEFIPAAEENGLITQIGEYVLRTACRQNSEWIKTGLSEIPISVNLSPSQFREKNLTEKIMKILEETGLESRYLQFEITESTAMSDAERTLSILNSLYEKGITFIIDDFGIGYSSLNYLRKFPISTIKIDRYFIRDIIQNPNDAAIITAIFAMAHTMNLKVIAEGVETREQLEFLRSLQWKPIESIKCYGAQGFYFYKPAPAEAISDILYKKSISSNESYLGKPQIV